MNQNVRIKRVNFFWMSVEILEIVLKSFFSLNDHPSGNSSLQGRVFVLAKIHVSLSFKKPKQTRRNISAALLFLFRLFELFFFFKRNIRVSRNPKQLLPQAVGRENKI